LLSKFGGLVPLLTKFYPEHNWNSIYQSNGLPKSQLLLFKIVRSVFPNSECLVNYPHPDLQLTKQAMELDIFIPSLSLAFEYQGAQHYEPNIYGDTNLQYRDQEKERRCKQLGITLIKIPYWWDCKKQSLLATIHKYRPEIVDKPGVSLPISDSKRKIPLTSTSAWTSVQPL